MAPTRPPPRLIRSMVRSGVPSKGRKSRRQAQALASVPGSRATVLEALAATEGRPTDTMAGMVTKEPPPAAAFIAPASRPAPNKISADAMSMRGSLQRSRSMCSPFAASGPSEARQRSKASMRSSRCSTRLASSSKRRGARPAARRWWLVWQPAAEAWSGGPDAVGPGARPPGLQLGGQRPHGRGRVALRGRRRARRGRGWINPIRCIPAGPPSSREGAAQPRFAVRSPAHLGREGGRPALTGVRRGSMTFSHRADRCRVRVRVAPARRERVSRA